MYTFTVIYNRVQERRRVDNTTECRGKQLNCALLRIGLARTVGIIVSYTSVSMNGRICDLLTTENDVISEKRT